MLHYYQENYYDSYVTSHGLLGVFMSQLDAPLNPSFPAARSPNTLRGWFGTGVVPRLSDCEATLRGTFEDVEYLGVWFFVGCRVFLCVCVCACVTLLVVLLVLYILHDVSMLERHTSQSGRYLRSHSLSVSTASIIGQEDMQSSQRAIKEFWARSGSKHLGVMLSLNDYQHVLP